MAIPTRNRPDSVRRAVASVLEGTRLPDEIVISDQSSDDGTEQAIGKMAARSRGVPIRLEIVPGQGVAANRNRALKAARGTFVAFCDDDVTVDRRWLERMLHEWEERWDGGAVVITGPILPGEEFGDDDPVPGVRTSLERRVHTTRPTRGSTLYGGHFGASRSVFEVLGPLPFDERLGPGARYPGAEDEDLGCRALAAGIPIVYEPSIRVRHHPARGGWGRIAYHHSVGNGAMLGKQLLRGEPGAAGQLFWTIATALGMAGKAATFGQIRESGSRLLSVAGVAVGFARWLLDTATGWTGKRSAR